MPWWSWVVIWGVLILLTLGMLAWQGFRLFRSFMTTLDALGELADKTSVLSANAEELAPDRFSPAIFGNRVLLARAVEAQRRDRATARQARRDRLVKRGKLLQRAPVSQRTSPNA